MIFRWSFVFVLELNLASTPGLLGLKLAVYLILTHFKSAVFKRICLLLDLFNLCRLKCWFFFLRIEVSIYDCFCTVTFKIECVESTFLSKGFCGETANKDYIRNEIK